MDEDLLIPEPEKKKYKTIILVCIFLSIVIPFTFLGLLITPEDHSEEFFTYKEFHDNYRYMELEDGDTVYLRDTFSSLWYNRSTGFSYMSFASMDEIRTAPWGYDAGIPEDITDEFSARDKVEIDLKISKELNSQGNPIIIAHITGIEKV